MSLKFINLAKTLAKMNVQYVGTAYGCYGVSEKNLRKHKLWVAINEHNELVCAKALLNAGNKWLDELAHIKNNDEAKWNELVSE